MFGPLGFEVRPCGSYANVVAALQSTAMLQRLRGEILLSKTFGLIDGDYR